MQYFRYPCGFLAIIVVFFLQVGKDFAFLTPLPRFPYLGPMVVLKFGGTSVQDGTSIAQALDIVAGSLSGGLLLVASAMAGITNNLVSLVKALQNGEEPLARDLLQSIAKRHFIVLEAVARGANLDAGRKQLDLHLSDMEALVKGSLLLKDCSPRVQDALLGAGELLSTTILWAAALERGWETQLFDARAFIKTDENFGEAAVLWPETFHAVQGKLTCPRRSVSIIQGFIGSTLAGVSTVLGRGGSDYSAALFGAALGASEIQIWTDVDGIMTTDPRKVSDARSIPFITYAEAAELAFFGAKVVHPATIQPAVERRIPVLVKNTKNPSHAGTKISMEAPGSGLRAIAGRAGVTVVTVSSSRMLNAYGFLRRIFDIFDRQRLSVDLVATSEVSVSITVEEKRDLRPLVRELEELGTVKVEEDCAIVCLVGQDVWKDNSRISRVFQAIPEVPVRLISLGSSDINLSFVVSSSDLDRSVSAIHRVFFDPKEN